MTRPPAREVLTVFDDGEEAPGIIAYGLSARGARKPMDFPGQAWPSPPKTEEFLLYGDSWEVVAWEIVVAGWPPAEVFRESVRTTMAVMTDAGCRVAWLGAEGIPFCDPPQLFDPACMSGAVLAWLTSDGDFACLIEPDRPLRRATTEDLLRLRNHASGLADAS